MYIYIYITYLCTWINHIILSTNTGYICSTYVNDINVRKYSV